MKNKFIAIIVAVMLLIVSAAAFTFKVELKTIAAVAITKNNFLDHFTILFISLSPLLKCGYIIA